MPAVQTWLTHKIANKLSKDMNTEISIGGVDISWFFNGVLEDISVDDQQGKKLLQAKRIEFGLHKYSKKLNKIILSEVKIDDAFFAIRVYKQQSDINLQFIIDYFASSDTTASEPMIFGINSITLSNTQFIYDDENIERFTSGFDYNHINLKDISIGIHNFVLDSGIYTGLINHLKASDTCGFILSDFAGKLKVSGQGVSIENLMLKTPSSIAYLQFGLEYLHWSNWLDFIDSVSFNSQIDSCNVDFNDIAYFATALEKTKLNIKATGSVKGPVSNLKLRNFIFDYGDYTHFDGKINLSGLPDIEKSFIDIKMNQFTTNQKDIEKIRLPGNIPIDLPDNLQNLKTIAIEGRFTGFYNDFVSNANFKTGLGSLNTDLLIKPLQNNQKIAYNGKIRLKNFNIGGIIGTSTISDLTMNGEINGKGIDKNAEADVNIQISNIKIANYYYHDSKIVGTLKKQMINAIVSSTDSAFHVIANGDFDFSHSLPRYKFDAAIVNARVDRLLLSNSDTMGVISGKLAVDASGNNLDNLMGKILIDSLFFDYKGTVYKGDNMKFVAKGNDDNRQISLNSKYIDGTIDGRFKFAELGDIYLYILKNFIPALLNSEDNTKLPIAKKAQTTLQFNFLFHLKTTKDIFDIVYPQISLADNSEISGYFNAIHDSLFLSIKSNLAAYQKIEASNLNVNLTNHLDTFDINITSQSIQILDNLVYDSVVLNPVIYRDSAQILLSLGKPQEKHNSIFLNTGFQFINSQDIKASIKNLDIWFNDSNWVVTKPNLIEYKENYLKVDDFELYSKNNSLIIDGLLTESIDDLMKFKFKNFDLSFLNTYLSEYYILFEGYLTGDFNLASYWTRPDYSADFTIRNFKFNDIKIGTADINSIWNPVKQAIAMDIKTELQQANINQQYLNVSGFYYPYKSENNLDFIANLKTFPLATLKPFLSSFSSDIQGNASGKVFITGVLNEPVFKGSVKADVKSIKIDYLNTSYSLSENFVFTNNYFGFENATIYDKKYSSGASHTGNLFFHLNHNNFSDLSLDLKVKANNLEMLNTTKTDNDMFYGYALGDGKINISGPFNDLYFNIDVKPLKGSKIAIPMTETASVQDNEFITFVIKDSTKIVQEEPRSEDFNLSMDMKFDMTPEATVQLVMDEKVGDIITANGSGIININVDKEYNVDMYGSYQIEKGDYLFTMQNIINKHFTLNPGGTIVWEGDMLDARINMSATYHTEAKLYDLLQAIDTTDLYKRRSKVDCIININGSLAAPEINFNIDLPDESNDTREKVAMVLYTSRGATNQDIMNKNFISLLMLGKFQAPGGFSQTSNPNALASNATEALASQVSNWLNKMSKDVDIGLTWDPGDQATSQEIAVAISYQTFNDRLLINGKFGTGGESKSTESTTRIVGDLDVEYALTKDKNLKARVFNRTNYEDPLTRKAPYTQGAGIVYRKEYDSFRELFTRSKNRKKSHDDSKTDNSK